MIFIAAGGTGGHLFPAESLARALGARGVSVQLVTDERAAHYGGDFPASAIHLIHSATFASKNPFAIVKTCYILLKGILQARAIMKRERPVAVIGFGGYPTFPPMIAALTLGIPTLIHEQNAVLGRANNGFSGGLRWLFKVKIEGSFHWKSASPKGVRSSSHSLSNPK
jgi:UDP-N-acetylglucosamine--N-acetylmuramyl-(pentapeptide) pyrophosphoryl-undecaprenol N-acetylglucosamine transferase